MGDPSIVATIAVSQTIQLILAPSVMIAAGAVLLNGILGRFAAINDRVRGFSQERFELLRIMHQPDALLEARLREIDAQFPQLLERLRLEHDAALQMYLAIACFIGDMLLIAIFTLSNALWIALLALVVFLAGVGLLGSSVLLVVREVRRSLSAILFEEENVLRLQPDYASKPATHEG